MNSRLLLGAGGDLLTAETELAPSRPRGWRWEGGGRVGAVTGKNNHTWPDLAPN